MGETGKDEKTALQKTAGGEGAPPGGAFRRGVKSYVLRSGRMSPAQKRSYGELFPRFGVPFDPGRVLDYRALFGNSNPVTVEIGFGM
ncbi:MAG: hypothetical protein LBH26_09010, partial [Treponema sp.]|nr:hypothetical protein [Treponema sp.]